MTPLIWRKSTRSASNAGQCVEVGAAGLQGVAIRDTKNRSGGMLMIDRNEWSGLLRVLKG